MFFKNDFKYLLTVNKYFLHRLKKCLDVKRVRNREQRDKESLNFKFDSYMIASKSGLDWKTLKSELVKGLLANGKVLDQILSIA